MPKLTLAEIQAEYDRLRTWREGLPDVAHGAGSWRADNNWRRVWRNTDCPNAAQIAVDRVRQLVSATALLRAHRLKAGEAVSAETFRPDELWLDELCDAVAWAAELAREAEGDGA